MKTTARTAESGSAILLALVTTAIISLPLASYLVLVRTQNAATMRALSWNSAIPLAEAGVEEALLHLNKRGVGALENDGWVLTNSAYVKTRTFTNTYVTVAISTNDPPTITSTGYVVTISGGTYNLATIAAGGVANAASPQYTSRAIRVNTQKDGLFTKGMVAKNTIDLNGNNIRTDSFDSSNPLYSNGGLYDPNPTKVKDNGDIATNSGLINSILLGNANIWGHASTGPGGSLAVGPNGAVGSKAWNQAGNNGVQSGWFTDDMNVSFPDVTAPFTSGTSPSGGNVGGENYTYVLGAGNYVMNSLSLSGQNKMYVGGNAALRVNGSLGISGNAKIVIGAGSRLTLYMNGASASIGGNGVINYTGNATNFVYLGTTSNTSLSFSGNGGFTGVIYAPNADFTLGGGGNNIQDFVGASVTKTVRMNGHFHFHYDEALKNSQWSRGYVAVSWDEI